MSASGIKAGRAYVEVGTDLGPLDKGLATVQARLKAFGQRTAMIGAGLSAASAAVTGPIALAVKQAVASGSALLGMSQKTGASIESLSELRYAAAQADISFESLGNGIKFQQKNLAAALKGNDAPVEAFEELGLSVHDLARMTPDAAFERIADAIASVPDPTMRTASALAIFGKSGSELLPLFADGAKGIRMLREEAQALGLTVSSEDARVAEQLGDNWNKFWLVLKDVGEEIANAVNPSLDWLVKKLTPILVAVAKWISEHRTLVVVLATGAAILGVVGSAITALGMAIWGLSTALGVIAGAFSFLAPLVAMLNPIVAGVVLLAGVLVLTAFVFKKEWLLAFEEIRASGRHLFEDMKSSWLGQLWLNARDFSEKVVGGWATLGMTLQEAKEFQDALLQDQQRRREEWANPDASAQRHDEIDRELQARREQINKELAQAQADVDKKRLEGEKLREDYLKQIEEAAEAENEAKAKRNDSVKHAEKVAARGTFSAAEAFRISGQGVNFQQKIAAATERTAKNTEKLRDAKPLVITP